MKRYYILIVVTLLSVCNLFSQDKRVLQKEIIKSFPVSPASSLMINNFYGDVTVELWQRNEVEVKATIELYSSKPNKLNNYIEGFEILEKHDSLNHSFTSRINRDIVSESFLRKHSNYKIDYFVKLPVYLNLEINNEYGNISLPELSGNVKIILSYGTLRSENFTAEADNKVVHIYLIHARGIINKANVLQATTRYSNLNIKQANVLKLTSYYSTVDINQVYAIDIKSKQDILSLNDASKVIADVKYSELTIIKGLKQIDLVAKFGKINLTNISSDFSEGRFDISYTEMKLYTGKESCFKINSLIRFGDLTLPQRANVDNYISLDEKRTVGTIGCISDAHSTLDIRADFSDVTIFE